MPEFRCEEGEWNATLDLNVMYHYQYSVLRYVKVKKHVLVVMN